MVSAGSGKHWVVGKVTDLGQAPHARSMNVGEVTIKLPRVLTNDKLASATRHHSCPRLRRRGYQRRALRCTALHVAVSRAFSDTLIALLLSLGARVDAVDVRGRSVLDASRVEYRESLRAS